MTDATTPMGNQTPSPASVPSPRLARKNRMHTDMVMRGFTFLGALSIILIMLGLLVVLIKASTLSIKTYGLSSLTGTEWRANTLEVTRKDANHNVIKDEDGELIKDINPPVFGILPLIYGTIVSSAIALVLAVPLSMGAALFLVRLCPRWMKEPVSFLIEFLAAIPSIAYGFWGLYVLSPFLQEYVEPGIRDAVAYLHIPGLDWLFYTITVNGDGSVTKVALPLTGQDMFCGGIVLSIMIIPIITAISRDVLRQVPRIQIEGTVALGATWWQSSIAMLRYSRSALFGAVMLGLARAAGETMAVTMVIGNSIQISPSPFAAAQTMSSLLANQFNEANDAMHLSALSEVALVLLVMSLIFNIVARYLVVGKGSRTAAAH